MATQYTAGLTAGQILTAATMNSIGAAWETYTPTWTGLTVGNGTNDFKYCRINKTIIAQGQFTFGSTTTLTGAPLYFTLPFTAARGLGLPVGRAYFDDNSAGSGNDGQILSISTTLAYFYCWNVGGTYSALANVSATVPFTWAVNDSIKMNIIYEAA